MRRVRTTVVQRGTEVAGRNKWLVILVLTWLAYWVITTAWAGVELGRSTVSSYILGAGQTQFVSDGKVSAALAHPDSRTLKVLAVGAGLAPSTPTDRIRPIITYEASNADIAVHVPRVHIRVTIEWRSDGWHAAAMEVLP
jgi:hypothetical protein